MGGRLGALAADAAGTLIPFATGLGVGVRLGAKYGDDVIDTARRGGSGFPGGGGRGGGRGGGGGPGGGGGGGNPPPPVCFVAGTLVAGEDGLAPIEEIEVGDQVWSYNATTGEVTLQPVLRTFERTTDEVVTLTVDGEVIETTPKHPFYIDANRWVPAGELAVGQRFTTRHGRAPPVEAIRRASGSVTVYNLEVAQAHTYYVSASGILVQNACGADPPGGPGGPAPEYPGGDISEDRLLDAADDCLGPGYVDKGGGRYVSDDGLRQFQFGDHEVSGPNLHARFEAYDAAGRRVMENTSVNVIP